MAISFSLEHHLLHVAYQRPIERCQRMFIGVYHDQNYTLRNWELMSIAPYRMKTREFPQWLGTLSPLFVEIMKQVDVAKSKELDQLVGMGMRKALEFLVKDFAIQEHPDQKDNIRQQTKLGRVIDEYLKDENINACAKRAAWLGNDETHYERRCEEMDITNLEELIDLTVSWIDIHRRTKKYRDAMSDPKKDQ